MPSSSVSIIASESRHHRNIHDEHNMHIYRQRTMAISARICAHMFPWRFYDAKDWCISSISLVFPLNFMIMMAKRLDRNRDRATMRSSSSFLVAIIRAFGSHATHEMPCMLSCQGIWHSCWNFDTGTFAVLSDEFPSRSLSGSRRQYYETLCRHDKVRTKYY